MNRTPYMENVISLAYPQVAIEAIKGGFDGSFERAMAKVIQADYLSNHSEAREIVDSLYAGHDFNLKEAYLMAAKLITAANLTEEANK